MLLNFRTAYYRKGEIISNTKKIIKNYLKNKFITDIIIISFHYISRSNNYHYIDILLFLFCFKKVFQTLRPLEEQADLRGTLATIYDLFKLLFLILIVAHCCGCGFYFVNELEKNNYAN